MRIVNSSAAGRNQKDSELQKGWKVDQLPVNSLQDEEKPVYFFSPENHSSLWKLPRAGHLQSLPFLHLCRTEMQLWVLYPTWGGREVTEPAWPTLSDGSWGVTGTALTRSSSAALLSQNSAGSAQPSLGISSALSLPRVPARTSYRMPAWWNWDRTNPLGLKPAPRDSVGRDTALCTCGGGCPHFAELQHCGFWI